MSYIKERDKAIKDWDNTKNRATMVGGTTVGALANIGSAIFMDNAMNNFRRSGKLTRAKMLKGLGNTGSSMAMTLVGTLGLASAVKASMNMTKRKEIKRLSDKDKDLIATAIASKLI